MPLVKEGYSSIYLIIVSWNKISMINVIDKLLGVGASEYTTNKKQVFYVKVDLAQGIYALF